MPEPFATEFTVPVDPEAARSNLIREIVPYFGQAKFQMTAQSADGITFTRRYLSGWAFLGGLLTFPLGILVWALARRTQIVNFTFSPMGAVTRVVVTGEGPPEISEFVKALKETADAASSQRAAG